MGELRSHRATKGKPREERGDGPSDFVAYHPKAFLTLIRNVRPGLVTRTRIISLLERGVVGAGPIAQEIGMHYTTVLHHLHLLEADGIVARRGKRPCSWEITGLGQQRLPTQ